MSKEEKARYRAEIWSKYIDGKTYKPKQPEPTKPIKPEPQQPEQMKLDRHPPVYFATDAAEIVRLHSGAIAKFDIESLTDDIRSFGQIEFERGIEFAMKQILK